MLDQNVDEVLLYQYLRLDVNRTVDDHKTTSASLDH